MATPDTSIAMAPQAPILWSFVHLDQYSRPAEPASEAVRKGLFGMRDRLQQRPSQDNPLMGQADLRRVPAGVLQRAASPPDWGAAIPALTTAIEPWLETPKPTTPTQVLVGPPYSGVSELATAWARAHAWRVVPPPTPDQVLSGGGAWFNEVDNDTAAPLVIPSLERCYLRHHDGLSLVHRLIEWLGAKRKRCLLVSNSWAWAYFSKVFEVDVVFPPPFTLQALDHQRLQHWFRLLVTNTDASTVHFIQADTGKAVLPSIDRGAQAYTSEQRPRPRGRHSPDQVADFLKYVAGHSRGIPGIAWAIWRRSLQLAAHDAEESMDKSQSGAVFWVKPWSQLQLPRFHSPYDHSALLVGHALLLHGGLHNETLPVVLPLNPKEIMHCLHGLRIQGLVDDVQGQWHVTPTGYPAVRRVLESEGYLTDEF
jgi:hypothetical protein